MEKKVFADRAKQIGAPSDRVLRFCISDESPDRDNDIIMVDGWDFADYLKNPVMLLNHNYHSLPIGKCVSTNVDRVNRKVYADFKFPTIAELSSNPEIPSEEAQTADTVYNAYLNGYLSAVSVGFMSKERKERDDPDAMKQDSWRRGSLIMKQSLLEVSAVSVPANPNAVIQAAKMAKSMDEKQIKILEELMETKEPKPAPAAVVTPEVKAELEAMVKGMLDDIVPKAGAKLSAATRAHLQKGLDDIRTMRDDFVAKCDGVMAHYKGLMDGDQSEPAGNSTTETTPQTEVTGDVAPAGKGLESEEIDLASIVFKGIDSASADK